MMRTPPVPETPSPKKKLPSTTARLPWRSVNVARTRRKVLPRKTFPPDLLEITSISPSVSVNRLRSTVTLASCIDRLLVPMRIVSAPLSPNSGRGPKWLWSIRCVGGASSGGSRSQTTSSAPSLVLPAK